MFNVPKLRFREFRGEWKINELDINIISGNTYPVSEYSKSGTLLIQGLNIYPNQLLLDNPIYISNNFHSKKDVIIKKNDILLALNRPIINKKLKACIFKYEKAFLYQRAGILEFDKTKLSNLFLYHYLFSKSFQKQLLLELVGSDQPYIKSNLFKKTNNLFPQKPEQQKIANFLTSIDQKIEQLTKKEKLLVAYKKGVMQKIFSQEIRFRDENGEVYGDWVERKFKEVFERITTKNKENNQNVLTISAQQGLINQQKYFNKSVSAKDVTGYYLLHKNDFAYNKSYSKGYPMGAIKRLKNYEKGVVSTLYICFRVKNDSVSFMEQFFNAGNLNQELHKIAQEGARNHGLLNMSVVEFFNDISLSLPQIAEQTKIANFLSSIDKKIEQVNRQIEESKGFKKGLLQEMFV